jgi:DNA-binding NtrC family response regulator
MSRIPNLLIVDDEKATREGLRLALENDFEVYLASNKKEAAALLSHENIDVLLTDLRLGSDSGMDILDCAMGLNKPPLAVMMTAYGSVDTAVEAMRRGAWHFVTKPLHLDEVEMLLKRGLRSRSLEEENRELKQVVAEKRSLKNLIGKSAPLAKTIEKIEQVAPTRATVLIEGESGTGKEVVAHTIHQLSGRPAAKFVIVNCAALSAQLLESELFGHEKGSFTGASQRRLGRFEQADGGTIFLDEIGEIDATTQVKLLRVLSERTIERVGSNTPVKVDVRLIAATNKNLKLMVDRGEFREDLYFRLNVIKIDMPPLRRRGEDIVLLASAFLREFAQENQRPVKSLSDEALALLRQYPWPGNVRELRTVIEHGVVMCNDTQIDIEHLPDFLKNATTTHPDHESATQEPQMALASHPELNLHLLERQAIQDALAKSAGNRTLAAEWLGISRRTLQRKLKELGYDGL